MTTTITWHRLFVGFLWTDPPRILELVSDANGKVARGDILQMNCRWQNGNPPAAATLLNNRSAEVEKSTQPELTHTISDVSWHDAGTWTCQAPGALENKTFTFSVIGELSSGSVFSGFAARKPSQITPSSPFLCKQPRASKGFVFKNDEYASNNCSCGLYLQNFLYLNLHENSIYS